jgi:hypothetical protein
MCSGVCQSLAVDPQTRDTRRFAQDFTIRARASLLDRALIIVELIFLVQRDAGLFYDLQRVFGGAWVFFVGQMFQEHIAVGVRRMP